MIFAITDIETTGSYASANSITEIAVVLTDGKQVLDEFSTLVKPDTSIPYHITQLTGIDDEMVEHAPLFEDIADELLSYFEDAIFVAHNVGFDYSFIKKAYEGIGRSFQMPKLCTVRIARKVLPGKSSYSLGRLCEGLGIGNDARHRAMGDAKATTELFHLMVQEDHAQVIDGMLKRGSGNQWLPPKMDEAVYQNLPESCGVYYLLDKKGEYLYIGMSVNIKKRIRQHFGGKMQSKRRQTFLRDVRDIQYKVLGDESLARLYEDAEIRKYWPEFNYAQKRVAKRFGLFEYTDQLGYRRLLIQQLKRGLASSIRWNNLELGRQELFSKARELGVDLAYCGLTGSPATNPDLNQHNERVEHLLAYFRQRDESYLLKLKGRNFKEESFVWVERGTLKGYGFVDKEEEISIHDLEDRMEVIPSSEMTQSILFQARTSGKVIPLDQNALE